MGFPFDVKEMWSKAFRPSGTNTKVAVQIENTTPILVDNSSEANWDLITASYPDAVTEVYTYLKDSSVVQTLTVTYQSSSKKLISSVVKAVP